MHPPSSTSNDITLILLYLVTTCLLWQLGVSLVVAGGLLMKQSGFFHILFVISLSLALTAHPFLHTGEGMSRSHIAYSIYPLTVYVGCGCWDFLLVDRLVVLIFCLHFSYLLVHLTKLLATVWTRLPDSHLFSVLSRIPLLSLLSHYYYQQYHYYHY